MEINEFRQKQKELAKKVVLTDELPSCRYVVGLDGAPKGEKLVVVAVVYDVQQKKAIERKHIVVENPETYVSTYLAKREGPAMIEIVKQLEHKVDLVMVDGHGIAHPEKCGLATYVGVNLDMPAIGVAKNLLIGDTVEDDVLLMGELRGKLVRTKEHAKPLHVSPGHKVSIETAAKLAKELVIYPHKLPEPLHLAHRYSKQMAEDAENCESPKQLAEAA